MMFNFLTLIREHPNKGKREFEVHNIEVILIKIRRISFSGQLVNDS